MVKDKRDKTKLGNWEEGDAFAWEIKSEKYPEYNGRYIIYINTIIDKKYWKMGRTVNAFRVKITENNQLPKTKEELDKLEYIKTAHATYLRAKNSFPEETKDLVPDEFQLIYIYLLTIHSKKYKIPQDLIYLGNFNLQLPENEYIPDSQHRGVPYRFWENFGETVNDRLLKRYEFYKKEIYYKFTPEVVERMLEREQKEIEIDNQIKEDVKRLMGPEGKEMLKAAGIDIEKEKRIMNRDTYVGEGKKPTRRRK